MCACIYIYICIYIYMYIYIYIYMYMLQGIRCVVGSLQGFTVCGVARMLLSPLSPH